jgi:hypothetical protein
VKVELHLQHEIHLDLASVLSSHFPFSNRVNEYTEWLSPESRDIKNLKGDN